MNTAPIGAKTTLAGSTKNLYLAGAVAAIVAALIFRRNIGAELSLFTSQSSPTNAAGWFTLLENNSLTGLAYLNVFDIANYLLVAVVFFVVYIALKNTNKNYTAIAATLGIAGTAVYLLTNTAYSMLSLSSQYATATTQTQKVALLAAGQAVLANGDPGAVYQGTGGYVSLFLIATAGIILSAVMLRSKIFGKATAYVGVVAGALDLAYLVGLAFVPQTAVPTLSAACLSTAGLLLMIWHLLIGLKLYRLSRIPPLKEVKTRE